jgi:hypothetical protein
MFGWLFGETRRWLESKEGLGAVAAAVGDSDSDAASLTYCVNINCFAMRDHPKYAADGLWGGSKGWMAEMTAIAAQRRRGAELSEERQRRQDAVLASLKVKLAAVQVGDSAAGGLLELGGVGGALLNAPRAAGSCSSLVQPEDAAAVGAVEEEETGGSSSSGTRPAGGGGSPKGKKPRILPALGSAGNDMATQMARELEQQVKQLQKQLQEQKALVSTAQPAHQCACVR